MMTLGAAASAVAMEPGHQSISPSLAVAAFAALSDPAALLDARGIVLHANTAWLKALYRARSEAGLADGEADAAKASPPSSAGSLGEDLRRGWGMIETSAAACESACAALDTSAYPELALSFRSVAGNGCFSICLRSLGPLGVLATIRDVGEAEQLGVALAQAQVERDEAQERLRCFAELTSETLVVNEGGKILFTNQATERMFGYTHEQVSGKSVLDFAAPECHADIIAHLSKSNREAPYETTCIRADGSRFLAEVRGKLITYHGRSLRGAALLDITERRNVETLLRQKQREEERARAQSDILFALSTPLLPVSDEVLVVPFIGSLDSRRMARIAEVVLGGLVERRARFVIIDITGIPTLDSATALGLLRTAQGARLLGSQLILCGIRAEVAQELVRVGSDLSQLLIQATLKDAVAFAFSRTRQRSAPAAR